MRLFHRVTTLLEAIFETLRIIAMNQNDEAALINTLTTRLTGIATEISTKLDSLVDALHANGSNPSPSVVTALSGLQTIVDKLGAIADNAPTGVDSPTNSDGDTSSTAITGTTPVPPALPTDGV